jgi:hypothetical protein
LEFKNEQEAKLAMRIKRRQGWHVKRTDGIAGVGDLVAATPDVVNSISMAAMMTPGGVPAPLMGESDESGDAQKPPGDKE